MPAPSLLCLVISLPHAENRRQALLAQAREHQLDIHIVDAVAGKELDLQNQSYGYDRARRRRLFTHDLLPNEIACALSHRKALHTFLQSEAEYGVIMEDDAVIDPLFQAGISELINHLQGWEAAKLFTDDGKLYPLCRPFADAVVQPVFPKKLPWVAVGYLYTRKGAQAVYESMQRFWLPADAQIGHALLSQRIPTIGVSPGLIHSGDPDNTHSTLDATGARTAARPSRSIFQYLAYRFSVLRTAWYKARMRKMMSRRISRH